MSIQDFYNQSVTLYPTTRNKYGKPSKGTGSSIKVRFQEQSNFADSFANANAKETVFDAVMWCKPTTTIETDYVVLYESKEYRVIRVDVKRGRAGVKHHKKAFLQIITNAV